LPRVHDQFYHRDELHRIRHTTHNNARNQESDRPPIGPMSCAASTVETM
jgi:hypothetical protein